MPQVPGTKVWIKKAELAKIITIMEKAHPPERIQVARDFTNYNITKSKQSKTMFPDVYHFIIVSWFNTHAEERI